MIINLFPCRRVKNLNGNLRGGGGRLFQQDWGALTPRYILCRVTPVIFFSFFSKRRFDCCGETKIPRRIINKSLITTVRLVSFGLHAAVETFFFLSSIFFCCCSGHVHVRSGALPPPTCTNESGEALQRRLFSVKKTKEAPSEACYQHRLQW